MVAKMLWFLLVVALAIVSGEDASPAEQCNAENCLPPNCRCSSTDIPGGLDARDTPQFVLVTFDDAVNILNIETYREVLYNRFNTNNCPAGATFYVSHEYTNYQAVNELYNEGFEIALHSISHRTPQTYWAELSYQEMMEEIGDQKQQMAHFANIPVNEIKGVRIPFLQLSGDTSFQVMRDSGLVYDASWPTVTYTNPGLWPYTLDYASTQDCQIPPCPTSSIPGVWVLPLISWTDLMGFPCSFVDACFGFPDREDVDAWYEFIVTSFERHYLGTRAPFGFYIHESYLTAYPAVKEALIKFLDTINSLNDVFMVNSNDVIEWVKNPVPINEYKQQPCRRFTRSFCPPASCNPTGTAYWMQICHMCPCAYPWVGNPLGTC